MKSLRLSGKRAVKSRVRARTALGISVALVFAATSVALAVSLETGRIGPSLGITANGRVLHPIGRQTVVGDFPTGSALTPDGRFLWVADCGHGSDDVRGTDRREDVEGVLGTRQLGVDEGLP